MKHLRHAYRKAVWFALMWLFVARVLAAPVLCAVHEGNDLGEGVGQQTQILAIDHGGKGSHGQAGATDRSHAPAPEADCGDPNHVAGGPPPASLLKYAQDLDSAAKVIAVQIAWHTELSTHMAVQRPRTALRLPRSSLLDISPRLRI